MSHSGHGWFVVGKFVHKIWAFRIASRNCILSSMLFWFSKLAVKMFWRICTASGVGIWPGVRSYQHGPSARGHHHIDSCPPTSCSPTSCLSCCSAAAARCSQPTAEDVIPISPAHGSNHQPATAATTTTASTTAVISANRAGGVRL